MIDRIDRRSAMLGALGALAATGARAQVAAPRRAFTFAGNAASSGWTDFDFWRENRVFVPVEINGHRTMALLDSGVSVLALDRLLGATLGLRRAAGFTAHGLSGSGTGDFSNDAVTVRVGGVELRTNHTAMLDLAEFGDLIGHPLDVMLGRDLFDQLMVDLDFDSRRFAFHDPRRFGAPEGLKAVPLEQANGVHSLALRIDGAAPMRAAFDLGAGDALTLSPRYVAGHPTLSKRPGSTSVMYGVEGWRDSRVMTADEVRIGEFALRDVPIQEAPDWSNDHRGGPSGNLGIKAISRFRVATDFPRRRLWLAPRAEPIEPIEKDRSGLRIRRRADHLEVVHVAAGGPAINAGFHVGDRITAVNERPIVAEPPGAALTWHAGPVGAERVLTLADGSRRTLVLADYY